MASLVASQGPLELLILQPTPFCNINCSYCYLPDRQSTKRMTVDTLEHIYAWVFSSGLVCDPFTLLWHAGEPLVLPVDFYEDAIERLQKHNLGDIKIFHSFQTNATLIDKKWCDFIKRREVHMGVSVDGPDFLHDRYRRTRQGKGTLERVLKGLHCLQDHGIDFYVITVLTADALDYPDELFDFYREHRIQNVAFNTEEIEGPNTTSTLQGSDAPARFRRFFARFLDLALANDPPLKVREYETAAGGIFGPRFVHGSRTQENKPWAILNIDCDGNFSTYSPELLGLSSPKYGPFALGNVATDSLKDVLTSERFRLQEREIAEGVELCRQQCDYFAFCGGGAPANKYFENGSFASTETLFCRLHKQACIDVSLDRLEVEKNAVAAAESSSFE